MTTLDDAVREYVRGGVPEGVPVDERGRPVPGAYVGIDEQQYHADNTSVSVSGLKAFRKSPAQFEHQRRTVEYKKVFDEGSALHSLVLGQGLVEVATPEVAEEYADIVQIDSTGEFQDWRTKAAKAWRDDVRARGHVAMLRKEYVPIKRAADKVLDHPAARALLKPGTFTAETSLYAPDPVTGVMRRGRLDILSTVLRGGQFVIGDVKSCQDARPSEWVRGAGDYGYDMQAAYYADLVESLGLNQGAPIVFAFVLVEKTAPYHVSVTTLDAESLAIGRAKYRRYLDRFAECAAADEWPGLPTAITEVSLPKWEVDAWVAESAA